MPSSIEKLITYAMNLVHVHLGQAVDSCIIAKRYSDPAAPLGGLRPLQHRYAIASVIHGYAGLEGVANWTRFELFENRDSHHFSKLADEPIAVRRMVEQWRDHVKLEDKLTFLLERERQVLDPGLRRRIADVRGLRNLVAHGWIAETLFEVHRTADGFMEIKDSVSAYKSQFAALKFNPPDSLTFGDAQMALRAVLEAARQTLGAYRRTMMVPMYEIDLTEHIGAGELRDSVAHIMQVIDESPTRPPAPPADNK